MKSNLGQFQYIHLFRLLLIAPWGYAEGETPFFEEEIPQQKMVMSQRKSIKVAEKDLEKNAQALANTQEVMPSHQLMSPASQLIIPQEQRRDTPANQAMLSETMPKKEAIVSTKNPHQSSTAIAIQYPVDIIPEQGQSLQTIVPSSGALQTTQPTGKTKKKKISMHLIE